MCIRDRVKEGDTRCFGKHTVTFVAAPMVHWPEAMVTFDVTDGVLFAADAFGSFGALDGKLFNDEVNFDRDWIDHARRYYTNIVGKYGPHVQLLLKKAAGIVNDIKSVSYTHLEGKIKIVPLTLQVDGVEFVDDDSFDQKKFIKAVADFDGCPKSSCPSP